MTITSTTLRNTYTGNASTTVFAYQFRILSDTEIKVTVDGVEQTLTTDYTVSGVGDLNGGNVTFTFGNTPANGASIVLTSNPDFTQEIDYNELDPFPAESHEQGLDRAAIRDLAIKEQTDRTILAPQTISLSSNTITGTIDSTARALTITTAGPAASDLSAFPSDIDVILTSEASGDLLEYDGASWVNTTKGDLINNLSNVSSATGDSFMISDASDGDTAKRATVQSVINLALSFGGLTTDTIVGDDILVFNDASASNFAKRTTAREIANLSGPLSNGGYAANRYYLGGGATGSGTNTIVANTLYASPFIVGAAETFTRIGFEVTTGDPGNARLGIYQLENGVPTDLVLDAGTVSTNTTGLKEITISQALSGGVYALAIVFDATPAVRRRGHEDGLAHHLMGVDASDVAGGTGPFGFSKSHTFGALPDPFGAVTYEKSALNSQQMWLRVV